MYFTYLLLASVLPLILDKYEDTRVPIFKFRTAKADFRGSKISRKQKESSFEVLLLLDNFVTGK